METWPPQGELGGAGSATADGGSADGYVRDLTVTSTTWAAGVSVEFAWEQRVEGSHVFVLYVDGAPLAYVEPGVPYQTGPLGAGDHEVHVIAHRVDAPGPLDVPTTTAHGDRVLLTWERSASADCAGYNVYTDGGTGTVNTATPAATVDTLEAPVGLLRGTGDGLLEVAGSYRGPVTNGDWTVTIEAGGETWTYATQDGASGESLPLYRGVLFNLPYGVRVAFPGAAGDYAEGDEWTFAVGPRTRWISGALEAGTHKFQIGAFDAAGNEATLTSAVSVVVAPEPQPPTAIAGEWDPATETVTLTWAASTTAGATYRVYSDWSGTFDAQGDHVDEAAPLATSSGTSAAIALGTTPEATLRFYVRAVAGGVEERNADLVEVSCVAVPLAPLATPRVTAVTPAEGGNVTVAWELDTSEGIPESFNVYRSTSDSWDDAALEDTVAISATAFSATGGVMASQSWTSAGGYAESEAWWGVRAVDGDDVEGPESNLVAATPDATAPGSASDLEGVPV